MEIVALVVKIQRQTSQTQWQARAKHEEEANQRENDSAKDEQFAQLLHMVSVSRPCNGGL